MNYVIIGNAAGAVGCVEGIRQTDKEGSITIVSREIHHTYSRPLISYLLSGKTDREGMGYRGADFYEKNGCKALLGVEVTAIQPDKKQVALDNGETLDYDRLLVATGSSPFVPPMEGLDTVARKTAFMTLDDALFLEERVKPTTRVLILGAGLIGLKCAEGLSKKTNQITVVDLADHILPSILDGEAAGIMEAHLRDHGLRLVLGDSVKRFESNRATLSSGAVLDFDLLVVAVGVRPNTALVKEAGGQVNRGIVTDEFCRTSLPDVYAAGDCTESFDITTGERRILALLPNAYTQGEVAGLHMAGSLESAKAYDKAIPMNAIGFFGKHIITAGSYAGEEYKVVEESVYKKLVYRDDLLKGYILMGDIERAGIYTSLIREQVPLSSIDFPLIKDKPALMAFSKVERAKKLGGVAI